MPFSDIKALQMKANNHIGDEQEDLNDLPSFLPGIRKEAFSAVPEGYFESLSDRILDKIEDTELLESAPVFSQIPKVAPPAVPANYFDELPEMIFSEIRLDEIRKQSAEPAYASYFEQLHLEIESAVILEKLQIGKEEPFAVASDYFDWLPSVIQNRILENKKQAFSWTWLQQLLLPKFMVPSALAFLILVFIGIRLTDDKRMPSKDSGIFALNQKDKKEVLDNFELFGFDENIVLDHVSACRTSTDEPLVPNDKGAAIDYLMDNNIDMSTVGTEN